MGWMRAWISLLGFFGQYFAHRLHFASAPLVDDIIEDVTTAIGPFVGVPKHFHLIGAEHVPAAGPVVVCSNHAKLDDPLLVYHAGRMATDGRLMLRVMMRDDYFAGPLFENRFVRAVEFFKCVGAYPISRDHVSFRQLKPFMNILADGGGFIIFPGRTRTRSGVFIEYRENFTEPGGVSLFLHHTQRRHSEFKVAALPIVRNYDPVSKRTALVFGPPLYLARDASHEQLRAFDYDLLYAMAELVEVNAAQVVCGVLYERCLRGYVHGMTLGQVTGAAAAVLTRTTHPHVNPEDLGDPARAVREAVLYLRDRGMLRLEGTVIVPDTGAILALPELNTKYRRKNPVRYLMNQILHLGDVMDRVESAVLHPGRRDGGHPAAIPEREARPA